MEIGHRGSCTAEVAARAEMSWGVRALWRLVYASFLFVSARPTGNDPLLNILALGF